MSSKANPGLPADKTRSLSILKVGCELRYQVEEETTFVLCIAPATVIEETMSLPPNLSFREDRFQGVRYHRVVCGGPQELTIVYNADVQAEDYDRQPYAGSQNPSLADMPIEAFPYLLPSRFCPSDRLSNFALRQFSQLAPGMESVAGICNWIWDNIDYQRGSSEADTIATETLINRKGVCRDFAHLGISFCRALNIPARLVSCYAVGLQPPDFHAIFEAYVDGKWRLFDATRQANLSQVARIATSADAAGASFASLYGATKPLGLKVWAEIINDGS